MVVGGMALWAFLVGPGIPPCPTDWATDRVGFLQKDVVKSLNYRLEEYNRKTGHEVVLYITDSAKGREHDVLSTVLFNAWRIGRAKSDDGVVLFIYADDGDPDHPWGHWHITVGFGFERALPDAECVRLVRVAGMRRRKTGDKEAAVSWMLGAIIARIDAADAEKR